jgi:single-stranded DNA-binding protein
MTRAINRVLISGNVARLTFADLPGGKSCCTFTLASDRHAREQVITAFVKINVYGNGLVRSCRTRLHKGGYVFVEGELMNRDGRHGELTEVRAQKVIFTNPAEEEERSNGS